MLVVKRDKRSKFAIFLQFSTACILRGLQGSAYKNASFVQERRNGRDITISHLQTGSI